MKKELVTLILKYILINSILINIALAQPLNEGCYTGTLKNRVKYKSNKSYTSSVEIILKVSKKIHSKNGSFDIVERADDLIYDVPYSIDPINSITNYSLRRSLSNPQYIGRTGYAHTGFSVSSIPRVAFKNIRAGISYSRSIHWYYGERSPENHHSFEKGKGVLRAVTMTECDEAFEVFYILTKKGV